MEFQLLKTLARISTLLLPLVFVACGGSNREIDIGPTPTPSTVAGLGCAGSYVGTIDKPSLEVRLGFEEELRRRRANNPDIDYPTVYDPTTPGSIYLAGSFAFETDANCKVVKGGVNMFDAYPFAVEGVVKANGSFDMDWTGPNVTAGIVGQINPDGTISGQVKHPAPDDFIYGLLNGKFTANGKI
jgi:hypothetical protein